MTAPIDPLLKQRLAQLNGRRPGAPLPPPTVGSAQRAKAVPTAPKKAGRRAKPARMAKMSALAISATTTLGLTMAFAHDDSQTSAGGLITLATTPAVATPAIATASVAAVNPVTTAVASAAATPVATTPSTTVVAAPTAAGIVDGTYVGDTNTNRWGPVQVQVVYSAGAVADVQILQYPTADRKSVNINQRALPTLISEAVSAQSADVNTVSGATYTSKSYRLSLQSAIDAAKVASGVNG